MTEEISLTRQLGEAVARFYHAGMDLLKTEEPKKYETTMAQLGEGAYVFIGVSLKDDFYVSGMLMAAAPETESDILFKLHASNVDAFGPTLTIAADKEPS